MHEEEDSTRSSISYLTANLLASMSTSATCHITCVTRPTGPKLLGQGNYSSAWDFISILLNDEGRIADRHTFIRFSGSHALEIRKTIIYLAFLMRFRWFFWHSDLAFFGGEMLLALFWVPIWCFICVGIVTALFRSSLRHDSSSPRHPGEAECQSGHEDFPGTPRWTKRRHGHASSAWLRTAGSSSPRKRAACAGEAFIFSNAATALRRTCFRPHCSPSHVGKFGF